MPKGSARSVSELERRAVVLRQAVERYRKAGSEVAALAATQVLEEIEDRIESKRKGAAA